jgi:hypothetical protein
MGFKKMYLFSELLPSHHLLNVLAFIQFANKKWG